jgi:hypothetical protein
VNLFIDITHARRASLFNADTDDGRVLVRARSAPFRDAACALLDRGLASPGDVLSMRLDGHVALVATAGALAELGQLSGRPARCDSPAPGKTRGAALGGGGTPAPAVTLSRQSAVSPRAPHAGGRPLKASESQIAQALELRARGGSLRAIVEATSLGRQTVRTILGKLDRRRANRMRPPTKARDAIGGQ